MKSFKMLKSSWKLESWSWDSDILLYDSISCRESWTVSQPKENPNSQRSPINIQRKATRKISCSFNGRKSLLRKYKKLRNGNKKIQQQ